MGSLIMPSDRSALYTIEPTLKIVPQDGIILVTPEADMAGPMAKSTLDLVIVLDAIVDPSKTTVPKNGYQSAATGEWGNIRIGFVEPNHWHFTHKIVKYEKEASDQMVSSSFTNAYSARVINKCFKAREWKAAHEKLATVVKVVKPVTLLSLDEATGCEKKDINHAFSEKTSCLPHPGF
jgi:amidase